MVSALSPSKTWMLTAGWLSACVEKICALRVGISEFLGISWVITPPTVSMPRVRGATSSITTPCSFIAPLRMAACTAAP